MNRLYSTIVNDPRRRDVELLSFESTEGPLLTEGSMRFIGLEKMAEGVLDLFHRKYAFKDGVVSVPSDKLGAISLLMDVQNTGMSS